MPFLSGLWAKLIAIGILALSILAALGKIFYAGKQSGRNEVINDVNTATANFHEKEDSINAAPLGLDDAVERLRKRTSR